MLQIKNLSLHHLTDLKVMMKDLNVTVLPGEKVAIIGEEGNGKSTLLKWIVEDSEIEEYVHAEGTKINHFGKTIYLPQSLPQEDRARSLEDYFFGMEETMELDYSFLYQVAGQLGFDSNRLTSSQLIENLSGGEKVKVQILKALAKNPDFLLLDEPSNDLDLETVQWLEYFIKTSPLAMMFISHDESLLAATATKVIQLELLRHKTVPVASVLNVSYQDYVAQKEAAFHRQTQVAHKQREEYQNKMEKHRQVESSVHDSQRKTTDSSAGRLLKKKMHVIKSMGNRFEREAEDFEEIPVKEDAILVKFSHTKPLPNSKTIVQLENATLQLNGQTLAQSLQLLIRGPEKVGIVGRNGIGKSTLLKQLWQELQQRTDLSAGYMPQNYMDVLHADETPLSFLTNSGDQEERTQIMTYLGSLRYTRLEMDHPIRNLSGGQQAKLLLLKMDLEGNNVLLLDEPTRNFSPLSQRELRTLFKNFEGAILTVSHDRLFLQEVCDKVYELQENQLVLLSDF